MTPLAQTTVDLYAAGMSLREVAEQTRVCKTTVLKRLRRAGCQLRKPGQARRAVFDVIQAYAELGSWSKAAEVCGLNTYQAAFMRCANKGFKASDARSFRLLTKTQREAYRIALDEQDKTHAEAIAIARGK